MLLPEGQTAAYQLMKQNTKRKGDRKMEKEMMEKVNEVLKAHGKRELNMNEMEQVTGGNSANSVTVFGQEMSRDEFDNMMLDTAEQLGYKTAAEMFEMITNFPAYGTYSGERVYASTDRDKMADCLDEFWHTVIYGHN